MNLLIRGKDAISANIGAAIKLKTNEEENGYTLVIECFIFFTINPTPHPITAANNP